VAEVDPGDDGRSRWILQWFRFDPERNERRRVTVAAYSRKREFDREFRKLQADLNVLKSEGRAEDVEYICGVKHGRGYLAGIRQIRQQDRLSSQEIRSKGGNGPAASG
jgi:hypothetical protein